MIISSHKFYKQRSKGLRGNVRNCAIWLMPSLTSCCSSHLQCTVGALIVADLARWRKYYSSRNRRSPSRELNLQHLDRQCVVLYLSISTALLTAYAFQKRSRPQQLTLCRILQVKALQAPASEGLAQGPYMAARAGFDPTTLRSKGIDSTNTPPRPTRHSRLSHKIRGTDEALK